MITENGKWTVCGIPWDDPKCLHSAKEAIELINNVGFMPFFTDVIPGFSLEEYTEPKYWWSDVPERDPWEWRETIARSTEVAYGKFFGGKAGFISRKWLPYFVNYRRDGYDFDALWDDEKASLRQKKIMDNFMNKNSEMEIFTNELKQIAGFGKGGEKGFDGVMTLLQMQTYLCVRDFRQRRNKKGEKYGWAIAIYSTPEHIWGKEYITDAYSEEPEKSGKRIIDHMKKLYPSADDKQINHLLGVGASGKLKK